MRSARMAEGSWLLAIMRSSVFRSRTASPYRYVSPSTPVTHPDTDHFASLEDQMASPIRVIPNILFLFRNQISRPTATGKRPSFLPPLSTSVLPPLALSFFDVRQKMTRRESSSSSTLVLILRRRWIPIMWIFLIFKFILLSVFSIHFVNLSNFDFEKGFVISYKVYFFIWNFRTFLGLHYTFFSAFSRKIKNLIYGARCSLHLLN